MKRTAFFLIITLTLVSAKAQKYESIKTQTILNLNHAKADFDKAMSNSIFFSKPEAYILKATIYAGLAMDSANKNTPTGRQYLKDADTAFIKYREMDPTLELMKDPIYQNGPINLYSGLYFSGLNDYNTKKWDNSFEILNRAVEYSDLLIEKKMMVVPIDTNVLILAGIAAENSNHKDDAAKYYGRLADKKITSEGFESVYRFMVNYYFSKKGFSSFEKYKTLGKELYPNSEYFDYDKIDFAVGLETNFNNKLKAVEEVLISDPDNYKANEVLGELIFDTLNTKDENAKPLANADELEKKMVAAFNKAVGTKPDNEIPFLYLGDHFIYKAIKVDDERTAFAADMKSRIKPGVKSSAEDVAKRDALDKKYGDVLELARGPYEKAAEIFEKKTSLSVRDKQQYKKAAGYLADIYSFKKIKSTGNPAAQANYAAQEKKWNEKWESLK